MKGSILVATLVFGATLVGSSCVAPANASPGSDEATRQASRMYAQNLGLPWNYFDVQQAQQKYNEHSGNRNSYSPYSGYSPYGGYSPYNSNSPYNNYDSNQYNGSYPYYGHNPNIRYQHSAQYSMPYSQW